MSGKLIGVGVGPGDPELLTVKAVRLIRDTPVLAYTVDAQGQSYARQSASAYIRPGQVELPLAFSMSTVYAVRRAARQEAARRVLEILLSGLDVVYITEGDPLLYSTFTHLLAEMPPEIVTEVCPGVSAIFSAAAAARFPLAVEGQKVIVAAGDAARGRIRDWMQQGIRIVLFKVSHRLADIAHELEISDIRYEAVLVGHASTDDEFIIRQADEWSDLAPHYFSILLIRPLGEEGVML